MTTLAISTTALAGDDATYATLEGELSAITTERDAIASQMIATLEAAEFSGAPVDAGAARRLIDRAEDLLARVHRLAH